MTHSSSWQRIQGYTRGLIVLLALAVSAAPALGQDSQARAYPLASSPLEILERLSELKIGTTPGLSEDERTLLAKAWDLNAKRPATSIEVDDALLLDALLFASGVTNVEALAKYRQRFDGLATKARAAVKDAKDSRGRGDALMKFLHSGVMSKGYKAGQSSFTEIFDTGEFNCVSSVAMYHLVGKRLGMELRPISIPGNGFLPGHAALDLVDGDKRVQVEPTNPDGFDWQTKINKPGVVVIGFVPDRKDGHEVDALGIPAMIYSNRGVELATAKPPKRLEAVACYLAALALDPGDASAANNLLAVFVNWGPELTGEKKFEEAVRVLGFGRTIAPKAEALDNNQRLAWLAYIDAVLQSGKDQEALTLIGRAARAVPDGNDFQVAQVYSRYGDRLIEKKEWEAALAVAERGLKVVPDAEMAKLRDLRSGVFRGWSQAFLDSADADGSLKVLARAYALDPEDKEILAGIAFHVQEALPKVETKNLAALIEHFKALRRHFPNVVEVGEGGAAHAERSVEKLADTKKFKEAIEAVEKYAPLFTKPEQRTQVGGSAFDLWGRHLAGNKEWKPALDKYAEGLKAYPKQERLVNGALATVDEWAAGAIDAKDWDAAIAIYRTGLEHFPGHEHLLQNKEYCEKMKQKGR